MKKITTPNKILFSFVALTILTTVLYALTTGHIWEDFFITFRHSKNLVEGYGLVYQEGERVHGFTSVINTLLPALFYWLTGESFTVTIWLYRIASIIALAIGGLYFLKEIQKQYPNNIFIFAFFSLLFAFQTKTIMFTTNGQEAGFMILFLLPSLIFAFNGYREKWRWAGICWAGLIYTRPDGVIYILLLSIASFSFGNSNIRSKKDIIAIFKVAAICTLLYLPWFIFAWVYYGSPIPHTITAKAALGSNFSDDIIRFFQAIISFQPSIGTMILEPTYFHFGGWPNWVKIYAFISWFISSIYWLIPSTDRLGRFVSFIYTFVILYFCILQYSAAVYPWYFPPAAIMSIFIISTAIHHLSVKIFPTALLPAYAVGLVFLVAATNIYFLTLTQITLQQNIIEDGNRKEIGLWLSKNKKEKHTVFLESLGYIGYYSNAKMYDWPGLVSPEVVKVKKSRGPESYPLLIETLKPNWLVLRPSNINYLLQTSWFNKSYSAVKFYSAKKKLALYKNIAGKGYLDFDSEFIIFKRSEE